MNVQNVTMESIEERKMAKSRLFLFSKRRKLAQKVYDWLAEQGAATEDSTNIITALHAMGYLINPEWQPTPETINMLPEPLRTYIHDLETLADPGGKPE